VRSKHRCTVYTNIYARVRVVDLEAQNNAGAVRQPFGQGADSSCAAGKTIELNAAHLFSARSNFSCAVIGLHGHMVS
jgi:hypothetical protein